MSNNQKFLRLTIKTYSCLHCGKSLEASECIRPKGWFVTHFLCPDCGTRVCTSGTVLLIVGAFWALFWGMILCAEAEIIGMVGFAGFAVIGIGRIAGQCLAARRSRRKDATPPSASTP